MPQERILVVQDEGIVADDIRQSLGRLGYIVESVPSGEAAVQICGVQRFALVLLDVVLPGQMDGVEAAVGMARCPYRAAAAPVRWASEPYLDCTLGV